MDFEALLAKQRLLTGYLEYLLRSELFNWLTIITPADPGQRGNQLSVSFREVPVRVVREKLDRRGVVVCQPWNKL